MRKIGNRVTSLVTVLLCVLMLASCGVQNQETAETDALLSTEEKQPEALVSIYVEDEDRYILNETEVSAAEEKTVFELLMKVTQENKIHMEYSGNGETAYVMGIDNLYAGDKGEMSGWMLYVNGKSADKGAGSITVHNGDKIEWIYVVDYTEE